MGYQIITSCFNPVPFNQNLANIIRELSLIKASILNLSNHTVKSVGLSMPTDVFNISGTPITGTGVFTVTFDSQNSRKFFAAPLMTDGVPSFRYISFDDIDLSGRTLTINGVSQDLGEDREWTTTNQSITLSGDIEGMGTTNIVTTLPNVNNTPGNYGTEYSIPSISTNGKGLILNITETDIPLADTTTTGLLTSTDWNTFNSALTPQGFQNILDNDSTLTSNNTIIGNSLLSFQFNGFTLFGVNVDEINLIATDIYIEGTTVINGTTTFTGAVGDGSNWSFSAITGQFNPADIVQNTTNTYSTGGYDILVRNQTSKLYEKIDASLFTSQWTTTGSDIYYTTGNVGIGTATPTKLLDITDGGASYMFFDPANKYSRIIFDGGDDGITIDGVNNTYSVYCGDNSSYQQTATSFSFYNGTMFMPHISNAAGDNVMKWNSSTGEVSYSSSYGIDDVLAVNQVLTDERIIDANFNDLQITNLNLLSIYTTDGQTASFSHANTDFYNSDGSVNIFNINRNDAAFIFKDNANDYALEFQLEGDFTLWGKDGGNYGEKLISGQSGSFLVNSSNGANDAYINRLTIGSVGDVVDATFNNSNFFVKKISGDNIIETNFSNGNFSLKGDGVNLITTDYANQRVYVGGNNSSLQIDLIDKKATLGNDNGSSALVSVNNAIGQVNIWGENGGIRLNSHADVSSFYVNLLTGAITASRNVQFSDVGGGAFIPMTVNGVSPTGTTGNITIRNTLTKDIFTPTTGQTVNLVNGSYNVINPAGALLALTLNLPGSPANNDVVEIKFIFGVTTVTYTGGTVAAQITTPVVGTFIKLVYDSTNTTWY